MSNYHRGLTRARCPHFLFIVFQHLSMQKVERPCQKKGNLVVSAFKLPKRMLGEQPIKCIVCWLREEAGVLLILCAEFNKWNVLLRCGKYFQFQHRNWHFGGSWLLNLAPLALSLSRLCSLDFSLISRDLMTYWCAQCT